MKGLVLAPRPRASGCWCHTIACMKPKPPMPPPKPPPSPPPPPPQPPSPSLSPVQPSPPPSPPPSPSPWPIAVCVLARIHSHELPLPPPPPPLRTPCKGIQCFMETGQLDKIMVYTCSLTSRAASRCEIPPPPSRSCRAGFASAPLWCCLPFALGPSRRAARAVPPFAPLHTRLRPLCMLGRSTMITAPCRTTSCSRPRSLQLDVLKGNKEEEGSLQTRLK